MSRLLGRPAQKPASGVILAIPFTVPNSDQCERDADMRLRRDLTELALDSIDLPSMDLGSVRNPDQQTTTSMSECLFAVSSSWRKSGKAEDRS